MRKLSRFFTTSDLNEIWQKCAQRITTQLHRVFVRGFTLSHPVDTCCSEAKGFIAFRMNEELCLQLIQNPRSLRTQDTDTNTTRDRKRPETEVDIRNDGYYVLRYRTFLSPPPGLCWT